jgi:demethylmenaquinone methyltransferase/2-methoxy-6-polyprenyl-1,4-benzoquinol methylase
MPDAPASVTAALDRADAQGFALSSEPGVGELLSALAAAVPERGRILELGTGAGVGLAWLVEGLGARGDVEVVSVDVDDHLQSLVRQWPWPSWVRFETGDGAELVTTLGSFDLVFADAPGGKTHGLDRTVAALNPGGVLVVDDMAIWPDGDAEQRERIEKVTAELHTFDDLVLADLTDHSSGVILATKRRG